MNNHRLKKAARNWWDSLERSRWERDTIGRLNADGTYTVRDETRPGFVHIRADSGSMTIARDVGKVQLRATLPVRMRREAGVLILESEDTSGLLEGDTGEPDNDYGVPAHPISIHTDVAMTSEAAGNVLKYDGTDWINSSSIPEAVAATIDGAAAKTTPVGADDFGITDSEAANVLKKLSWSNLVTGILAEVGFYLAGLAAKVTPVDADSVVITDSAAGDAPKRVTFTNITTYIMAKISALTTKTPPVAADAIVITDSAAADVPKRLTFTDLGTYLTTLYMDLTTAQTVATGIKTFTPGIVTPTIDGSIAANGDLTLQGTTSATRASSYVLLQPNGGDVGVGVTPGAKLDLGGAFRAIGTGTTPSANGAGQAIELWYWTGAGGPYGLLLAFDRDAGTYKPVRIAGDSIGFEEGASRIMTIDGGNVGILVNPALTPLQVRVGTNQNLGVALSTDTTISAFNDAGSANVPLRILSSLLQIKAGSAAGLATVSGVLESNITIVGVSSGAAQDLMTYSIPASALAVNGQSIWFEAIGSFSNSAAAKTFTINFGATVLGTQSTGGGTAYQFHFRGRIWRTGAATQRAWCEVTNTIAATPFAFHTTPAETLSGAITIKGVGDGGAANEVFQLTFIVGWDDVGV